MTRIVEEPGLRDRVGVFHNRTHAGEVLSGMLSSYLGSDAIVMAIPAGGIPVAAAIAERLKIPLDVAVVSKITPPWNTEVGYGAVAFDGSVKLNEPVVRGLGLSDEQVEEGIAKTLEKVRRRLREIRGDRPLPELSQRPAILVDDGLASGFTMRVAVSSLTRASASRIVVAVPTAHQRTAEAIAPEVDVLYCANVRGGRSFAVADAYQDWSDIDEEEIRRWLAASGLF